MHQSLKLSERYGRQVIRRIVPILGTCGLIYWLEGGIPPAALTQILQVLAHLNALWASNGANTLISLVLLIAQVLCIGLAWGCLLWLIVREFQALLSGNVSQQMTSIMHPHHASATPPFVHVGGPAVVSVLPPTTTPFRSNAQPPTIPPHYDGQPQDLPQYHPSGAPFSSFEVPIQPPLLSESQPFYGSHNPDSAISGNHPHILEHPFDTQDSDSGELASFEPNFSQATTPSSTGINTPISGSPPASTELTEEEEDPFIFGNPFEEPLPNAFHHDLRKAIIAPTDEMTNPPIEQTKPKRKMLKKKI